MTIHTSQTLLGLLLKGGWLMLPLGFLSLITIYIIAERLCTYRKYLNFSTTFLQEIEDQLNNADFSSLKHTCADEDNIIKQIISKGLKQRQHPNLGLIIENESNKTVSFLEEKLSLLATISGVAPMIGFLGTVTGMIQTFMAIAQDKHQISSQVFSGGIYEAMVTTVAGLIVGIIAYLGYNYCIAQVTKATVRLTYLVNLLIAKL